ncbi:hypothetical protein HYT57_05140 [Candidatus Woesearchaeota archaeon]|nr:hypothetical protein [Candidatus Woesearchaeota archaeon]
MGKLPYVILTALGISFFYPESSHNQLNPTDCGIILVHSKEDPKKGVFTKHYVADDYLDDVKTEIFQGVREKILIRNRGITLESLEDSFTEAGHRGVVVRVLYDELMGVKVTLEVNVVTYDLRGNPKDLKAELYFLNNNPDGNFSSDNPRIKNSLDLAQQVLDEARR